MSLRSVLSCSVLAAVLTGCSGSPPPAEPSPFGHVHGLGENPADGRLYVASHTGVYEVKKGRPHLIADRRQDTMGFDIVGPDAFIASGHPASADKPNPMGFITSDDAGQTWKGVSLVGESDLHAIDVGGDGSIIAVDVQGESLIRSTDQGQTWKVLTSGIPAIDIASSADGGSVVFSTLDGEVLRVEGDGSSGDLPNAPTLTYLDSTPEGDVVGLGPDGRVWRERDDAWTGLGELPGEPSALSVSADAWYAAAGGGIFSSLDEGMTWEAVLR